MKFMFNHKGEAKRKTWPLSDLFRRLGRALAAQTSARAPQ